MPKKGVVISLAAKCQLLFGLAVLVIIAGALAVPWQRMEQLAGREPVHDARTAAGDALRYLHVFAGNRPAPPDMPGPFFPPTGWQRPALFHLKYPAPQIIPLPNRKFMPATHDPVTLRALRLFRQRPNAMEFGRVEVLPGKIRIYRYAAAVRADISCIRCHSNWRSRLAPRAAIVPTMPPGLPPLGGPPPTAKPPGAQPAHTPLPVAAAATKPTPVATASQPTAAPKPTVRAGALGAPEKAPVATPTTVKPARPAPRQPATIITAPAPVKSLLVAKLSAKAKTVKGSIITAPAARGRPAAAPRYRHPLVAMIRINLPVQIDADQLLLNRIVIVIAGMLGLTLAVVVFYLITNRLILQPVRVLRNTAEKVRMGDLNIRSAISTGDEFEQLSDTFNNMLTTLKASQDQLEATNRSLDTRVGELAQMNVDLYEANRMKSEFLTNVSHELRTPLNAIIGFAELLISSGPALRDPKLARYVENIRASARQLLDLINDLLDLAKIEAGKMVLRKEKINVGDGCEALLNFMKPLAQKKNIDLALQVQPEIPLIITDPARFQQILYNFLSNAIKFTPADGAVRIVARRESVDRIRVSVTDTGPGIAPENHKAIFEKFRQVDGSVTRQHSGTGLGLAISRDLAGMLGGVIELASAAGKGATFSLVLPIEVPVADAPPERRNTSGGNNGSPTGPVPLLPAGDGADTMPETTPGPV